jgi:hypothetical protein
MTFYELLKGVIIKLGLAVRTDVQTLSDEQKAQARENIGAMPADVEIPSVEGLATETYVDDAIAAIPAYEAVQSDWSVNNPTSDAYIKNRPFFDTGTYDYIYGDVLFEGTVEAGNYYEIHDTAIKDALYEVVFDGEIYELTCYEAYEYRIGDLDSYPFVIYTRFTGFQNSIWFGFNDENQHTVKITRILSADGIVRIDEKFLPNSVVNMMYDFEQVETIIGNHEYYIDDIAKSLGVSGTHQITKITPVSEQISEAIAAIPTPDVSGQIATHNTATSAHSDIREAIAANTSAIELLTNGASAEEIDSVNDLIQYVNEHGSEVTGMKADIKANTDAIADKLSYNEQTLTEEQKAQARANIGAGTPQL